MLMSISLNSMSKYKSRVLPQLLGYYEKYGKLPENLVFSLAALIRFYRGFRGEEKIELKDDAYILEFYDELWKGEDHNYTSMVEKVLKLEKLWGCDLSEIDNLLNLTSYYINEIDNEGIKKSLETVKKY